MTWQLIYTSAPRGLEPGHSGFATVARSRALGPSLVRRLERMSARGPVERGEDAPASAVVLACWTAQQEGLRCAVLSRIAEARADFTGRSNHVAHHLILPESEWAKAPSPAAILWRWPGWREGWNEPPRFIEDEEAPEWLDLPGFSLPARAWQEHAGDAGRAAALVDGIPPGGVSLLGPTGGASAALRLFGEALELLDPEGAHPERRWEIPFIIQARRQSVSERFQWRMHWPSSESGALAPPREARRLEELTVPEGHPAVEWARTGRGASRAAVDPPAAPAFAPEPSDPTPRGLSEEDASRAGREEGVPAAGIKHDRARRAWEARQERGRGRETKKAPKWSRALWTAAAAFLCLGGLWIWNEGGRNAGRRTNPAANRPNSETAVRASGPAASPTRPAVENERNDSEAKPKETTDAMIASARRPSSTGDFELGAASTYLVVLSGKAVELTPFPEMETLLNGFLAAAAPLTAEDVECRVGPATGGVLWETPDAGGAFEIELTEKWARIEGAGISRRIDFQSWSLNPNRPFVWTAASLGSAAAIEVSDAVGGGLVPSFFVVEILPEEIRDPLDVEIDVPPGGAEFGWVGAARRWIEGWEERFVILNPEWRIEARPFVRSESILADLYLDWPTPPPPERRFAFDELRAEMAERIQGGEEELAELTSALEGEDGLAEEEREEMEKSATRLRELMELWEQRRAALPQKPEDVLEIRLVLAREPGDGRTVELARLSPGAGGERP